MITLVACIALTASAEGQANVPKPTPDLPKKYLVARPKPDAVLAKVGAVPIRASDIESYLWDWRAYEAVSDAVTHQMIAAEAKLKKVVITDAEIERELKRQLETLKAQLKPGQTVDQLIRDQGFPRSRLYLRIRSELLLGKLVMATFDAKRYVKVSAILIRPRSEQGSELAAALRRADDAYAALRNGEPWEDVLGRYTDDAGSIQNRGLLGWKELAVFPPTVRQDLATLRPGGITKPAQTGAGIQIFRLESLGAGAEGTNLGELKQAYEQAGKATFLDDLRKRTKIEIFLGK